MVLQVVHVLSQVRHPFVAETLHLFFGEVVLTERRNDAYIPGDFQERHCRMQNWWRLQNLR